MGHQSISIDNIGKSLQNTAMQYVFMSVMYFLLWPDFFIKTYYNTYIAIYTYAVALETILCSVGRREDSDQPAHIRRLNRVIPICLKRNRVLKNQDSKSAHTYAEAE